MSETVTTVDGAFGAKVEVKDDGNGRKVFRVTEKANGGKPMK